MLSFKTREVPFGEWATQLSAVSASLSGEPVRIWVDAKGIGHRVVAGPLPLLGMSYVEKGSEAAAIEVTLGEKDDPTGHYTHLIDRPARFYIQETEDGSPQCLWFESRGTDDAVAEVDETLVCFDMNLEPAPGVRRLAFVQSKKPGIVK